MRNLKRALSLAMASVMTLGMMTVGTSAKGIADFSDAAEITNVDAVAVTSAVGIFKGYEDGEFKGNNVVTRAEMAVICAKLLYGADVDPAQFTGINKFTDVPTWAEGYVNLCASLGIIVGRDETTFDPNATVSTVEASVMLAKTLGYFKNEKDFGSDWKLATTAKATSLGLYGDLKLAADAGLTRDSVAELVFNTMTKAVPVDYNELLGVYYNQNQGIVYALEFNYLQTLGYKNFDLVYRVTDEDDDTVYGRPTTIWGTGYYMHDTDAGDSKDDGWLDANGGLLSGGVRMLDRDEIVAITDTPDYVYTAGVKENAVRKALGSNVCDEYAWDYYVNGELVEQHGVNANGGPQNVDADWDYATKGAVTEIYIDKAQQKVTLCEINYYLGEVSSVKEDDDGEYANIKTLSQMENLKLDSKKFYTNEVEADDLVVFTVDYKDLDDEYYIPELFTPATATGEISRVEDKNNSDETYIRLVGDSDKYEYASKEHIVYDVNDLEKNNHPDLNEEYILYMTPAGYVLGYEKVDETVDQYLWVKDSDEELKDWIAKVVLTDGSSVKVDVASKVKKAPAGFSSATTGDEIVEWKSGYDTTNGAAKDTNIDKSVFKYSVSDKGVYTLTYVDYEHKTNMEINNDEAYISGETASQDVLVNSKTIFVDVENGETYVGHKNVPNVSNAEIAYVTNSKKVAVVVFILDGDIYDKDATYFFLADDDRESLKYDDDYYYEYFEAYDVEGEKFTLTVEYDAFNNGDELEEGVVYQVKKTIDEIYVTEVVEAAGVYGSVVAAGEDTFRIRQNAGDSINTLKFDTDEDTQIVLVEELYKKDGSLKGYDVSKGDLDDMIEGIDDECMTSTVYVVEATKQTAELVYIFNHKTDAPVTAVLTDYVSDVKIDGMENGAAELGDTLILEIAVAKLAAAPALDTSKVYSVIINGTTYYARAFGGYLYVEYVVDSEALEAGNGIQLKIGKIAETKKSLADVEVPSVTEINNATFKTPTQEKADGTVNYNIYVTGVCYDNGYSEYTVNSDAAYVEVKLAEDKKTVEALFIKAVDPEKVKFGTNAKVYYDEAEVSVDADGKMLINAAI